MKFCFDELKNDSSFFFTSNYLVDVFDHLTTIFSRPNRPLSNEIGVMDQAKSNVRNSSSIVEFIESKSMKKERRSISTIHFVIVIKINKNKRIGRQLETNMSSVCVFVDTNNNCLAKRQKNPQLSLENES